MSVCSICCPNPERSMKNIWNHVKLGTLIININLSPLQWHNNEHDGISNHWRLDCLLNRLFRRRSKKTSKLHVTCLCKGNSSVTSEFTSQRVSNMENVSIIGCHHVCQVLMANHYYHQTCMKWQLNCAVSHDRDNKPDFVKTELNNCWIAWYQQCDKPLQAIT